MHEFVKCQLNARGTGQLTNDSQLIVTEEASGGPKPGQQCIEYQPPIESQ